MKSKRVLFASWGVVVLAVAAVAQKPRNPKATLNGGLEAEITSVGVNSKSASWIMLTMAMKNPVHPGLIVRHDCLEPLALSVTEGAKALGVTRQALNNVVNGKSGISPEMAIRLSKVFGSASETWSRMQLAFGLAAARKHEGKIKVRRQHLEELRVS
jgi:addiction module HigA family antidote